MKLNPSSSNSNSSTALLLLLSGLLLPSTNAFTSPAVFHITKGAVRHPLARAMAYYTHDAPPAHVMTMETSGALDRRMGIGMGGLARLLDDMTADPFFATPGPSSLWKRLDMSAPAMAATIKVDVKEVRANCKILDPFCASTHSLTHPPLFHNLPSQQQTDKAYMISADLPGVKKEDVKLSFSDDGALMIEAERHESKEETQPAEEGAEGGTKYFFKETTHGKVYRSFKLPQNADTANVDAKLADGVLSVSIPKRALPTERTIEIK